MINYCNYYNNMINNILIAIALQNERIHKNEIDTLRCCNGFCVRSLYGY